MYVTSQECMSFTGSYKYLSEYFCIYLFLFLEGRKEIYIDALYSPYGKCDAQVRKKNFLQEKFCIRSSAII